MAVGLPSNWNLAQKTLFWHYPSLVFCVWKTHSSCIVISVYNTSGLIVNFPTILLKVKGGSRFCGARSFCNFWGPLLKKNYEHGIRYGSKYLFRTHPRTLEEAHASDGPWSLSFISFMENLPLLKVYVGNRHNISIHKAFPVSTCFYCADFLLHMNAPVLLD